jgi:phage-related protein/cell wall-associated NlpC family hydrolase
VAVSIEAAFVLVDNASKALRKIELQAIATDKALKSMGGASSGGAQGWNRSFSTGATKAIGDVTKATKDLNAATDDTASKVDSATKKVRTHMSVLRMLTSPVRFLATHIGNLAKSTENWTRNLFKNHPALVKMGGALGAVGGGVKGLVTALPLMASAALAALGPIVALGGAIGALAGSLSFAVGGGALLGGGLLGSFAVGLGSVVAVAKPAITQLQNYQKAVKQLQTAEQSGSKTAVQAAQRRLDAINKANPGVAKLGENLKGLENAWKKATAPGRAAFFDLANTAIGEVRKNMGWLAKEADTNTKAVADAFKKNIGPLADALRPMIQRLGSIFRANLPGFAGGITNIVKGLSNILKVLEPQLKTFGTGFDNLTKRFDEWTSSNRGQKSIKLMGEEFKQWGRILGGVARILGDVLGAGARASQGTIKNWADSITKFATVLGGKGGTKGVQSFFAQSLKEAGKLVKPLETIAKSLGQLYTLMKPFGSVIETVVGHMPPALLTAGLGIFLAAKTAIGASKGYGAVTGALSKFGLGGKDRGDRPTNPLFVAVVAGAASMLGGGGLRERFGNTRLGRRLSGTRFGQSRFGKFLGLGGTAETAVGEAEQLALPAVEGAATKGGFLSRLFSGGKGLSELGTGAKLLEGGGLGLGMAALPLVTGLLPKGVRNIVNSKVGRGLQTIGSDTAIGATVGSIVPGLGTGIGAGVGAGVGAVSALGWNPFSDKGRKKFVSDMKNTWSAVKDGAGKAWGGIQSAAGTAVGFVKKHWEIAGAIAGPVGLGVTMAIKHFGAIKSFLGGLVGSVTGFAKKIGSGFASGIKSGVSAVAHGIGSAAHAVGHVASGAAHAVGGAVSSAASAINPANWFAHGGRVPSTSDILVGEAGPEVLHVPGGSRVTPLTGPYAPWPQFGMQTGFPTPLPRPGGGGIGGGLGGILGSALGIDLSPQGIGRLVSAVNDLTNALTGRDSLQSALQDVGTQFDDLSNSAQTDWQSIEKTTKDALDSITANLTNANDVLAKNYETLVGNIQKSMTLAVNATQQGVNTIFQEMAKAFQTLGVSSGTSKRLAKAGFGGGGKAKGNATGGRLPGEPQGDHLPLLGRGGSLLGIADGGELVVNRHTEKRVDAKLAAYGTTLGHEVAGETQPHYARGGRIPRYATGGVIGAVDQFFSGKGFGKVAIAGILGNAMQESGLNPGTAGGGMWQQISNFGSGTGGPLLAQMQRMYPQIASLRGPMNAAASPGAAATIFEQQFERAGIPALANRIRYANEAFAGKLGAGLMGGAGFLGTVPKLRTPNIGRPGMFGRLGQRAINALAAAANGMIQAQGNVAMGGAGAAPMTGPAAVQAMVREADKIAAHHYNYEWGGGHGAIGVPGHGSGHGSGPGVGFDCSGTVSAVLHAAGLLNTPLTSGPLMSWGAPGPGKSVTIWASPVHTFMAMNGHYFGTSGSNTGGGAGWIGQFPESMPAVRHPPGLAMGGRTSNRWAGLDPVERERQKRNPWAILPDRGFAQGGRVPWFASGADFIARRPTVIGVGDAPGGERVTVTPQHSNTTAGRPVTINIGRIEVNRKGDVQKIVDEEMKLLAQSIGRTL